MMKIIILTLTVVLVCRSGLGFSQQPLSDETRVKQVIEGLWSARSEERELAKVELIRLNEKAVPSLLALLEDTIGNPAMNRFATGHERDGALLLSRPAEANIEITTRLESDAIYLLGELRASEAIPLLVKVMESRMKENWLRVRVSPEMTALAKIGESAVPAIVRMIEDIREGRKALTAGSPGITEEELAVFENSYYITAQTRGIIVLGEIGSLAALPVLEKLLAESNDPKTPGPDLRYVEEAVKRIREKAK